MATGHDRRAGREGLGDGIAEVLVERGKHEHVETGKEGDSLGTIDPAQEVHPISHALTGRHGRQPCLLHSIVRARDDDLHAWPSLPQPGHGAHEAVQALLLVDPAQASNEGPLFGLQGRRIAQPRAAVGGQRRELGGIDAVRHGGDPHVAQDRPDVGRFARGRGVKRHAARQPA